MTPNKIIEWEVTPDLPHIRLRVIADTGNGQRGHTFYIDPSFGVDLASYMIQVGTRLAEELHDMECDTEVEPMAQPTANGRGGHGSQRG